MNPTGNPLNPPPASPNPMTQGHGGLLRDNGEAAFRNYNMNFYGPAHINMYMFGGPGSYNVNTSGGNMYRPPRFGNPSPAVRVQTPQATAGQGVAVTTGQFNRAASTPRLFSIPYPDKNLNKAEDESAFGNSYFRPSKI